MGRHRTCKGCGSASGQLLLALGHLEPHAPGRQAITLALIATGSAWDLTAGMDPVPQIWADRGRPFTDHGEQLQST